MTGKRERLAAVIERVSNFSGINQSIDWAKGWNENSLDSLDRTEIIMGAEEEFLFTIPAAEEELIATPNDLLAIVEKKGE